MGTTLDERSYYRSLECADEADEASEASACNLRAQAKANFDRHLGAKLYVRKEYSPAENLVLSRDRGKKLRTLYASPALLAAFCTGDADGDMVPDTTDNCPNSRPLRPTDANGCEDTVLPPTPPREAIDAYLDNMGLNVDPRCVGAPRPSLPFFPSNGGSPVTRHLVTNYYWIITNVERNQPPDCELEYQFAVTTVHANGSRAFTTLTFSSQNDPRVITTPLTANLSSVMTIFSAAQGGDAALWGVDTVRAGISAQVVNGNGEASGWTPVRWANVQRYQD